MIVKSGRRICGTGAALANAPIVQDKAYFEMKIQCRGELGIDKLARYNIVLSGLFRDTEKVLLST